VDVLKTPEGEEKWGQKWKYVLVDEVQDVNKIQDRIMALLAENNRNLCVVGDDSQCQPGETLVQTTHGEKRIDELDPAGNYGLISYLFSDHESEGVRFPSSFKIAKRLYHGSLLQITGGANTTRCTPTHLWPVRLKKTGESVKIPASNLIPENMEISLHEGTPGELANWVDFTIGSIRVEEPVYSLDVERYHNYVADGFIVLNSIYEFRGAEVEHIMKFKERWEDAKVIKLEHNYRSTPEIIEAANAMIEHNKIRLDKILRPTRKKGDAVLIRKCPTTWDEAEAVGRDIQKENLKPDDVAIIYRTNAQSRTFEEVLGRRGIPYHVVGGVAFLGRSEIKTARAYLNLIIHPRDRLAFRRAIENPRRGVGPAAQESLFRYAVDNKMHLIQASSRADDIPGLSIKARASLREFSKMYQEVTADTDQSLEAVMRALLSKSGYLPALKKAKEEDAIANIGELVSLLGAYDNQEDTEELAGKIRWLEHTKQFLEYASLGDTSAEKREGVALMTIHATKGLEFPRVYLVGLEEELFFRDEIQARELEEGRRLLYVGMTRAKERLTMSYCCERVSWGRTTFPHVLRFLKDLPASVKKIELKPNPNRRQQSAPLRASRPGSGRSNPKPQSTSSGQSWRASSGSPARQRPERATPQKAMTGLVSGARVSHAKFGAGVIVKMDGEKAIVRFSDMKRMLDTRYAKLELL
jgi:ATP-dependent exoDNAse (exonuclease V) beta subunit